jgi:hypothetical protein
VKRVARRYEKEKQRKGKKNKDVDYIRFIDYLYNHHPPPPPPSPMLKVHPDGPYNEMVRIGGGWQTPTNFLVRHKKIPEASLIHRIFPILLKRKAKELKDKIV